MSIALHTFAGARPIVQPFNLRDNEASHCVDCYFQSSGIDPLKAGELVASGFSGAKTIYRIANQFISISQVIDIVRSPIIQDKHSRLYFTTTNDPDLYESTESEFPVDQIQGRRLRNLTPPNTYISYGGAKRLRPSAARAPIPSLLKDGVVVDQSAEDFDNTTIEKYATFRITFVTDRGEETAPGMASDTIGYIDDVEQYGIRLEGLPFSANPWVTHRRIYVAIDGGDYFLIDEIPNPNEYYAGWATHDLNPFDDDKITDLLISEDWDPAPTGLSGLCSLPNGVLAGFLNEETTGTVRLSFPFQPHAWPVSYSFKSLYQIVALLSVPQGLLVLTKGKHLLITGSTPDVMQEHVIESGDACLSKSSAIVSNGIAYWASSDGIAAFGGQGVVILSKKTWSRSQWKSLQPPAMHFEAYEDHLLVYANSVNKAFIYSLQRHDISDLSETGIACGLYDVIDDKLFLVRGNSLVAFNEGALMTATWESKHYIQAKARPNSSARLVADGYPIEFSLMPEGDNTFFTKDITNDKPYRLKSTGRKRWYKVKTRSNKRVDSLQVAVTMQEIV